MTNFMLSLQAMIKQATINPMPNVRWKLPDLLDKYDVTPYQVGKKIGRVERMATVYRLAKKENPPSRADFKTMADILAALCEITGEDIQIQDLLEFVPDEPTQTPQN